MSVGAVQPADPAAVIDWLARCWDGIGARLVVAEEVGPDDLVTCEIWAHGAAVVVTDSCSGLWAAYALGLTGTLLHWNGCGWSVVEDEPS